MHKWTYEKTECLKNELEAVGFDNLDCATLEKAENISKILKNIIQVDKDYHIVDAMEKEENEEKEMEMIGKYTDYPEKRHYRDSMGRYARRRYTLPDYQEYEGYPELYRDMDVEHGKMYYHGTMHNNGRMPRYYDDAMHDSKMGKSGMKRKAYIENKDINHLEEYMVGLREDMTEMVSGMRPEEKDIVRNRMSELLGMI